MALFLVIHVLYISFEICGCEKMNRGIKINCFVQGYAIMHQRFRIPAEDRTSVSKLRDTPWQQRLLLEHEDLDLISFFQLPRALIVDFLINWITLETLCIFDTAVSARDSRKYLLREIFLDNGFIVPFNTLENLQKDSLKSTQNAVLFARYLHFRRIYVKILDFTHWKFSILDISDFLKYLWHFDVENERYRQMRALILPRSAMTFEVANMVGSRLQYLWYLSLSGCRHALGDTEFKNLIFTCNQLTFLDVSHCNCISSDAIIFMANRCVHLEQFIWQGHNTNSYLFLESLSEFCGNLQLLDLSTLYCERFTYRDLCCINLDKYFPKLTYINLSGCDLLTEPGIVTLVSTLTNLEYFSMCFERPGTGIWRGWGGPTPITDACIVALSLMNPNLKELYIRGCSLLTNNCLVPLSQNCKLLKHLDVTGTSCTPDGFDCFNDDTLVILLMGDYKQVPFYVQHLYYL